MTEDTAAVDQSAPNDVVAQVDDRDWLLQDMIKFANLGLGMGITLIVQGAVVSGTLIGGKQFFDELKASVSSGNTTGFEDGPSMMQALGDMWGKLGQSYVKPVDAGEDWEWAPAGFIHLNNARIYAPGQPAIPSNKGLLWRGKLNAVGGFSLGSFDPPS